MKPIKINLSIHCFVFLISLLLIGEAVAANYYASPIGSGTTCSDPSPCKISSAWSKMSAGDTLYLKDGTYTGADSMIKPPDGMSGASGNPITISAINDGGVLIDGQNTNRPIALIGTNYVIVQGINAKNGTSQNSVVQVSHGSHNTIRRVIAWDAYDSSDTGRSLYMSYRGSDNLFEDVAGWGHGRKIFGLQNDTRTTFRRCFFRHTGHSGTTYSWKVGLTIGYNSDSTTVENCVGTWDRESGNTQEAYAIFGPDNYGATGTVKVLGNIGYFLSGQNGPIYYVFASSKDYGNVEIKDTVMYTEQSIGTFYLYGSNHECDYCTSIGGSTYNGSGTTTHSLRNSSISSLGGDILQYNSSNRPSSGAWIKYRYENGQLTSQSLWPWPMEERIKDALVSSGYAAKGGIDGEGGTSVTRTVFELGGGTMPADLATSYQCSDGKDNDGDGKIDYPNDPGCSSVNDNDETNIISTNSITALKTLNPISIDGNLLENAWTQAGNITFSNSSISDNQVTVYTLWDNNNLYFAFNVTDPTLEAKTGKVWYDDGVEILLDTGNEKTTAMDSNDYKFLASIIDVVSGGNIISKTVTNANGYITEIAIPWSSINKVPSSGMTMGLLLANDDVDNGVTKQFDWLNLISTGSYSRPNLWGSLVISGPLDTTPPAPPISLMLQ